MPIFAHDYVLTSEVFYPSSGIDWSKSISEIDAQLYRKYGLEKDEVEFIERMIKPME